MNSMVDLSTVFSMFTRGYGCNEMYGIAVSIQRTENPSTVHRRFFLVNLPCFLVNIPHLLLLHLHHFIMFPLVNSALLMIE